MTVSVNGGVRVWLETVMAQRLTISNDAVGI